MGTLLGGAHGAEALTAAGCYCCLSACMQSKVGNIRFNAEYEAKLHDRSKKPKPNATMDQRERFIRDKYEGRVGSCLC